MQLDLFEDNRPGILLNIADEYLQTLDFEKALSVCEQVRDEYPDNRQAPGLCTFIQTWLDMISGIDPSSCHPAQLHDLLINLESVSHPPLKTAGKNVVANLLQALPEPDFVFLPPRFHLGHVLLDLGRFAEAMVSFRNALSSPGLERGRFLTWSADAITLSGKVDDALNVYLQALLEDPDTIDFSFIKHQTIQKLHLHCSSQADGIEEVDEVAWLPVWGWLQGVFPLPLQHPPAYDELELQIADKALPIPRLWYNLLTLAEFLRTEHRNDRQMAAVRRLMKRLQKDMFECYMQKIRGTKQ